MTDSFDDVYDRSMADPEAFWADAASGINWIEPWTEILDRSNPPHFRWFTGGVLNTCYNCVDRHVEAGHGDQAAIIYDSALTDAGRTLSYSDLLDQVSRFAGALAAQDVGKGDRVILYMPMVPEAVVAALACARIGAVHSIVFGGFAANELAVRIDDCTPKVIVTASCGIEPTRTIAYKPLLDEAIALAGHTPDACIILQRPQVMADLVAGRDFTWDDAMAAAQPSPRAATASTTSSRSGFR